MFSLQGKTAIVTGAGSGIGRAVALLLAQQGAEVHLLDINADALQNAVTEIKNSGGQARSMSCDVTSQQTLVDIVSRIPEINILVNSAGISHIGNVETTSSEDFDRLFSINVKGIYNCLYAVIPVMKKKGGVIVNMASVAGHVGLVDRFAYSMTKGAVHAMSLSVAKDYLGFGIRCNSVSPARVHTPFVDGFLKKNYPGQEREMFEKLSKTQPIGRMAKPEEIAHLVLYLCSDEASFITGNDYPIDGGFINLNN
ncbi:MAG TPA: SDR family oxidoreductase [Chitinophagaceae bacterium]|nr:SDR family oxidoreductase [Chitinophagaceae bacterium]